MRYNNSKLYKQSIALVTMVAGLSIVLTSCLSMTKTIEAYQNELKGKHSEEVLREFGSPTSIADVHGENKIYNYSNEVIDGAMTYYCRISFFINKDGFVYDIQTKWNEDNFVIFGDKPCTRLIPSQYLRW